MRASDWLKTDSGIEPFITASTSVQPPTGQPGPGIAAEVQRAGGRAVHQDLAGRRHRRCCRSASVCWPWSACSSAEKKPVCRRHLLVLALEDARGGVRRRVVGADERLRAPQVAQHVVQDQRLLAARSATRSAATSPGSGPDWYGLGCDSEDTVAGRCVEVSRQTW